MFKLSYQKKTYTCRKGETVLEVLHRFGVETPFSCRSGLCHTCILLCTKGKPEEAYKKDLVGALRGRGYFLPCQCIPTGDMAIEATQEAEIAAFKSSNVATPPIEKPSLEKIKKVAGSYYPEPAPEIWTALGEGRLLTEILTDFYTQVYDDPRLRPFFEKLTKQRAIEKQYNFLYQFFSGEQVYFGENIKQAHHWMVISDELFDIREKMMTDCLRRHGLAENLILKWQAMEEIYREDIVKSAPWDKEIQGELLPVDGFDEMELAVGTLCDICNAEVSAGETVRYHLRLGTISCGQCMAGDLQTA